MQIVGPVREDQAAVSVDLVGLDAVPVELPKESKLELDRDGVIRWQSLLGGGGDVSGQ